MTRAGVDFVTARRRKPGVLPALAGGIAALLLLADPQSSSAAGEALAALDGGSDAPPASVLQDLEAQNPVVARVDGRDIRWRDVMTSAGDLAIAREDEARALFPVLLEQTIDRELLAAAARQDGLGQAETVKADVRRYEDGLLSRLYLERALAQATAPERLWARYRARMAAAGGETELRVRHILVKTRPEAEAVIAALDGGAAFAELAARLSIGPSAARGGDLGYFDPARMVAPFSRAALALVPGHYSKTPVETPFGWHVIQLLDLRRAGGVPFADVEASLRAEAEAETRQAVMRRLRAGSQIEILTEPPQTP